MKPHKKRKNREMKKSSIIAFAFLLFSLTLNLFAQDETRAVVAWRVLKYDINANLPQNPTDRYLSARAILNLQNVGNTSATQLSLRISDKAEVSNVTVNNATATFNKREEKLGANRTLQRLVVSMPDIAPNATTTVSVDYKLKVDENTGLNSISSLGSQFLPLAFWYPTPNSHFFTRGADFAPTRLAITNPAGETVIAPGKQAAASFDQALNIQPFFITGSWDTVESNGVSVYLPKGAAADERKRAEELAALANAAKTFTAGLLGNAPDTPLKIVAARRGGGFSDGGIVLLDYGIFRRQKIDSFTAMKIAESMAKVYLGNAVQVRGDGYGVIREGLPRFIATQFIEKQFGKEAADMERLRQRTAYASVARRDTALTQVSPIDDFYFASVTNKGAMIWRMLAKTLGEQQFFNLLRTQIQGGALTLESLRSAFLAQKAFLDYQIDQPTDMNLLAGLPQSSGAETKIALRNLGSIDATVNVTGTTANGEKLTTQVTVPAKSFGEAVFKTSSKIVRTEIDPEKYYPQVDFSDDVAPREFNESDAIAVIKRAFDKKDFPVAEKSARTALQTYPHFDEARMWLGRVLLAQGKTAEAEREFRAVLDEKLPTAQSLAWANVGLGEVALKSNQNAQALNFFNKAIESGGDGSAVFNARAGRNIAQPNAAIDETVRAFFAQFDKAAVSGRRADLDAMILTGEIPKFSSGIGGQAQSWATRLLQVDKLDANTVLAEVKLDIKILNRDPESGTAIYVLSKVGSGWKLGGVESFEVR
jgi:tetratricopeptide (TPR) repeat protein